MKDAELLTPAMYSRGLFIHRNGGTEKKVSTDEGSKHLNHFAARTQFLLDVRTQFQCNSRNSPIGTEVQLALRTCGQDMRASQNAPSREVYCLKGPCPGVARRWPAKRGAG